MKRFLSIIFLVYILVTISLCSTAFASEDTTGDYGENLTWTLDDAGTLTISGEGVMDDLSNSERPYYSYRNSIKKVIIENGVTCIGKYAFCNFGNLTEVDIPSSVLEIKSSAFYNCPNYTPTVFPESIEIIGNEAFADCNLKEIYIHKTVKEIGANAFSLTDLVDEELYYKSTFNSIVVDENNPYFSSSDGVLFNKDKSKLICYPYRKSGESYTIPSSVESIGISAFKHADNLKSMYIPNNVKSIGNNAFRLCSNLEEVIIANRVENIGVSAFDYCLNLQQVTLPDNLMTISEKMFYCCKKLTSLNIPSKVTTINSRAFYDCELLEELTLHNSVSYIGNEAFYDCDNLKNVYFVGTEDEWNNISKTNSWIILNDRGTQLHFTIGATGVTLNKNFSTFVIGETEKLTATVSPSNATNKNIVWSSSNNSVATVSNGVVTAVSAGTATITAETEDGGYTATCTVTVTAPVEDVKATFTLSDVSGKPGDTVKVKLSLKTDEAINSIAISNINYDASLLSFVGFSDYEHIEDLTVLPPTFDADKMAIVIGLKKAATFDGDICTLNFKIKDGVDEGSANIIATSLAKNSSTIIASYVEPGIVTVRLQLLGDVDGNDTVDIDDAVALFQYSMLPELYPINYVGNVDFDKSGTVDINDAVLLFQYSMLPDLYPIE